MPIRIDRDAALALVREAASKSNGGDAESAWVDKVEQLSVLCEAGVSKTHIAFLGTAIIAKAMNLNVDLFAIKPAHAEKSNANSYSARSVCETVLVPAAAEIGFNLGVTGRQPLNNQPYFRMTRLDDGTPVHSGGRAAFDYLVKLVSKLEQIESKDDAVSALRAFIAVRRRYQPHYASFENPEVIAAPALLHAIQRLVSDNSENGRRAQAVVAGLLDAFYGVSRVESGRVNDPSRNHPGDVCVRAASGEHTWEKAVEVRDKPVSISDAMIFGKRCVDLGVREAAMVMVSPAQPELDQLYVMKWAANFGVGLTLLYGWNSLLSQVLFWSEAPTPEVAARAAGLIHDRLVAVETTPEGVTLWRQLLGGAAP